MPCSITVPNLCLCLHFSLNKRWQTLKEVANNIRLFCDCSIKTKGIHTISLPLKKNRKRKVPKCYW